MVYYNCHLYTFLFFILVCCLKLGNSSKHCICPHVSNNTVFVIGNDTNCSLEYFLCHNGFVFHSYIKTLNLSLQHSHTISSGPYCLLENLTDITIQSDNSSQQTLIICSVPWRGFGFFNFSNLQLIGLTFHQCGGEIRLTDAARQYTNESTFYFSPHQKAVLLISYSNNTVLKSVSIKGPYAGFGIVLINVVGLTTKISNIDISDNMLCHSSMCSGSGLAIVLAGIPMQQVIVYGENVKIHNNFNHYWSNNSLINHFEFLKQSIDIISAVGITILTANYNTAGSYITLYNFTVFNNTSYNLPIVLMVFHSTLLKFVFLDTLNFTQNKAVMGSLENSVCGLYILSSLIVNVPRLKKSSNKVSITNSVFHSNSNAHIVYVEAALSDKIDLIIDLSSTKFADNRVSPEGSCIYGIHSNYALFDSGPNTTSSGYVSFFIEDIQVKNCHRSYKEEIIQVSALKFVNIRKVDIKGSHFSNNAGSAIDCYSSYLVLAGINMFINNTALLGGGISLRAYSLLWLTDSVLDLSSVQATFINNTALTYGGGIYSEYSGLNRCFLQIRHGLGKKIILINNSAVLSGSAVYADSLYNCHPTVRSIFHCQSNKNKLAPITSTPVHIYTCDGSANVSTINVTMYPGENISIGLRAYDAAMNPVYADAFVHLGIQSWSLEEGEYVKRLFADICNKIYMKLAVNDIINSPILQTLKLYTTSQATFLINIKMIPCSLGFDINDDGFCDCNKLLLSVSEHFKSTITCTGTTISLPSNAWFGISLSNKQAFSFVCHHNYCSLTAKYNALKTDSLCLDERTGIMCGTCPNTFSTVFGSDKCLHCSNIWLITIVGYAIAGLLLVLMLFVLEMTVSSGILGGLIFFANMCIINEHDRILSDSAYTHPFSIALSLLNLNLGFPLCFYNGMNTVMKVGLQFVFPIYLWVLVLLLVIGSHFSTRLSNLTVNNSVQVLATLFQFSFAKLLSTITMIFTSAEVYSTSKSSELQSHTMWFYDGNVDYLKEGHLVLFTLAAITTSLFIIPYLMITCCASKLVRFRKSHYVRPLIDAYHGPYKANCGYWLGVRQFLIVVSYGLYAGLRGTHHPLLLISLQTIGVAVFMIVQSHLKPFKNKLVGLLDMWFILLLFTLDIMVAMFLHESKITTGSPYVTGILGVYLVTVAIVLIYHVLSAIRCTRLWLQQSSFWRHWANWQESQHYNYGTFSRVQYREPLLESATS